jgi:iron complex outermembrane recepter protein
MKRLPLALAIAAAFPCAVFSQSTASTETVLKPVVVTAPEAGPLQPTRSATRLEVPAEQLPQSVVSVGRTQIDNTAAQNLPELLKQVSSVVPLDPRDTYNAQNRVRGFRAATLVDGVAMPSMFANLDSTINIEQLDVIKGPAPAVAGGGQTAGAFGIVGGAIAVQTKSPQATASRELGMRVGSRGERGIFFDLNQPINDVFGFRLVGETQTQREEQQGAKTKRTGLYPSLSIKPSADSELIVKARLSRLSNMDNSGLPANGTVIPAAYTIARTTNTLAAGQPDSSSEVNSIHLQWSQKLSQGWSYDLSLSRLNSNLDQNGVFTNDFFAPNAGPVYGLLGLNLTQRVGSTDISANLRKEADFGGARHKFLLGLDSSRTEDWGYMTPFAFLGVYDITAPVAVPWKVNAFVPGSEQDNAYRSTSVVLQDHISVGKNLHFLASLKHTRIHVQNLWTAFGINSVTDNAKTTPRLGAIYEFSPGISAFAGYGEGFSVPTNGIYTTPPKPEGAKQKEIGIKLKNVNGWSANIAWFDLRRTNVPISDPLNPSQSIQTGEQRSSGLDADFSWKVNRQWQLLGHFSAINPRISKDTMLPVGHLIFATPKRSARLAVRHDISTGSLQGLGLGLGVTHHSRMAGDAANSYFTPAATVWDAQVQYQLDKVRLSASINNLTDKKYFIPSNYFGGGHVLPAQGRQLSMTASYNF